MGRGKIEIKKIEDPKNRQTTFARRRKGLVKKAKELSILCSAEVGVIIFPNPGKIYTYPDSDATIQRILERHQRMSRECPGEVHSRRLQDEIARLDCAVRHMMGEDLNFLSWNELNTLEDRLDKGVSFIRDEKNRLMLQELETSRKRNGALIESIAYLEQTLKNRCSPITEDSFVEKAFCKEKPNPSTPLAPVIGDAKQLKTNIHEADAEYGVNTNLQLGRKSF